MKLMYWKMEKAFEKLASIITVILGSSITFILALSIVIIYLTDKDFYTQDMHTCIGEVILGVTFLTLFIIQKSFNRFTASLHLKVNELVASHESASNLLISVEHKSEHELIELSKEYAEMASQAKEEEEEEGKKAESTIL